MNEMCMRESSVRPSRIWLEVDLDILEDNFKRICKTVAPLKVMAVLKANAYGLGVLPVAERLVKAGADGFCVAELREALQLKKFGKPVQILGGLLDFVSERIPRAPQWMRKLNIEWCFRLYCEPTRLFKRYIIGNPLFIVRVFRSKLWRKK